MAAAFGTIPIVASFWMAFRFAHLLRRLFGEGALHVAFVPHFEHLRKNDTSKAALFFKNLSSTLAKILISLTVIFEVILGSILFFTDVTPSTSEILSLTMLMLPSLIFICMHALNSSLLQCEKSFFLPSVSPVLLNVTWIATVLAVWHMDHVVAIRLLSVVVVVGFCFQWLLTLGPARTFLKNSLKADTLSEKSPILPLLRPFLLSMLGVAATQINNGLDAIFAKVADSQGPAYLWYALRLEQLPLGLLGVGLSGALLPSITRAQEQGDTERYLHFLNFSLRRVIAFMIPITGGIVVLGLSSVNLLYGRGAFDTTSITETTYCLWAYGAGLLPMTLVLIFACAFYACKNYKIPTYAALGSVALNITLNALFVYVFEMGAISVAIATSIAAAANALVLAFFLFKQKGNFGAQALFSTIKITLTTLSAALLTALFSNTFFPQTLPKDLFAQLMQFGLPATLFGALILLFAFLFRAHDLLSLIPSRLKKIFIKN